MSDQIRDAIQQALSSLLIHRARLLGNTHPDFSGLTLAANYIRNLGQFPFRSDCTCGCHSGLLLCEGCCVPDEPKAQAYLSAIEASRLAALEESQPKWLPIETAPKVVGRIIGAVDGRARFICWGKTSHVPLYGWILTDQGTEDADLCEPTHWMHLPANPTTERPAALKE